MAGKVANVDFEFDNLNEGYYYRIKAMYTNQDGTLANGGIWDHKWEMRNGLLTWKANGTVVGMAHRTSLTAAATASGPGVGMTMAWPTMVPIPSAQTKVMRLCLVALATYLTMGIMMTKAASMKTGMEIRNYRVGRDGKRSALGAGCAEQALGNGFRGAGFGQDVAEDDAEANDNTNAAQRGAEAAGNGGGNVLNGHADQETSNDTGKDHGNKRIEFKFDDGCQQDGNTDDKNNE